MSYSDTGDARIAHGSNHTSGLKKNLILERCLARRLVLKGQWDWLAWCQLDVTFLSASLICKFCNSVATREIA